MCSGTSGIAGIAGIALSKFPYVKSECGHFYHFKCVSERLNSKWGQDRINFEFLKCPGCEDNNSELSFQSVSKFKEALKQNNQLRDHINFKPNKLISKKGNDRNLISMPIIFYMCNYCNSPYNGQADDSDIKKKRKVDEENETLQFLCPDCKKIKFSKKVKCAMHDSKALVYKCQFCCSVAVGRKDKWGNYYVCLEHLEKWGLNECSGKKEECPSGSDHPPNGTVEFLIGCGICIEKGIKQKLIIYY